MAEILFPAFVHKCLIIWLESFHQVLLGLLKIAIIPATRHLLLNSPKTLFKKSMFSS